MGQSFPAMSHYKWPQAGHLVTKTSDSKLMCFYIPKRLFWDLHNKEGIINWEFMPKIFFRFFCPLGLFGEIWMDFQKSTLAPYENGPTVVSTPIGHSKQSG